MRAEKGSKVSHTDSTEYNRALERENRRIQTENAELTRRNIKLKKEADELENRIDNENKILEIRAEEAQLPNPDFLRRYKEEDIRQYLQDAAGLHRQGSGAVTHYTMLELADRFKLMNLAFDQEDYRVDKNLEVIPMPKKKDS